MISRHISYKEGVRSNTATRRGIDNTPDNKQLDIMKQLKDEQDKNQRLREKIAKQEAQQQQPTGEPPPQ